MPRQRNYDITLFVEGQTGLIRAFYSDIRGRGWGVNRVLGKYLPENDATWMEEKVRVSGTPSRVSALVDEYNKRHVGEFFGKVVNTGGL